MNWSATIVGELVGFQGQTGKTAWDKLVLTAWCVPEFGDELVGREHARGQNNQLPHILTIFQLIFIVLVLNFSPFKFYC